MKTVLTAAFAVLAMGGLAAGIARAQQNGAPRDVSAGLGLTDADRAAFLDARVAALKAGLALTPEQEKLWPSVETALREVAKFRTERMTRMREAWRQRTVGPDKVPPLDPVAGMRERAERLSEGAAQMRKLADAAEPLYRTLDDAQKRRLVLLMRPGMWRGMRDGDRLERGGDGRPR